MKTTMPQMSRRGINHEEINHANHKRYLWDSSLRDDGLDTPIPRYRWNVPNLFSFRGFFIEATSFAIAFSISSRDTCSPSESSSPSCDELLGSGHSSEPN